MIVRFSICGKKYKRISANKINWWSDSENPECSINLFISCCFGDAPCLLFDRNLFNSVGKVYSPHFHRVLFIFLEVNALVINDWFWKKFYSCQDSYSKLSCFVWMQKKKNVSSCIQGWWTESAVGPEKRKKKYQSMVGPIGSDPGIWPFTINRLPLMTDTTTTRVELIVSSELKEESFYQSNRNGILFDLVIKYLGLTRIFPFGWTHQICKNLHKLNNQHKWG